MKNQNDPKPSSPEEVPAQPTKEPEVAPPIDPTPLPSQPEPSQPPMPREPIPEPNESEKIRRDRDFRPQMNK